MNNRPPQKKQAAHEITGASVFVRNDDVNGALRRLKKILEADDRQKDLAKHEFFEKKSAKRKRALEQARKRTRKDRETDVGALYGSKPQGVSWQKSKRKRRAVLDRENTLAAHIRKTAKFK